MKEIKPEDLIRTLLDGAPSKVFDFTKVLPSGERATTKIRVQVLRAAENITALKDSQDYAKDTGERDGYNDIYREAQAHEVLTRCLRHVDKSQRPDGSEHYPPLFTDSRQLRASFNELELAALLNCYQITKSEFGSLEALDEHDAETWIARLSDPLRGPFFLSQLDSLHWPGLIVLLAGIARDLCQSVGHPLPSLDDTSDSSLTSSTADTGSLQSPPTASSTDGEPVTDIGPDKILTREEARARVAEVLKKKT